jgi:DNA-binding transcriptional ArsR family regulator
MTYAKTSQFEIEFQNLALYAKVFSHPARLAMLLLLSEEKECIVGDIAQKFPFLSRTAVSQHLQELKAMGLIKGEIEGVKICYCLDNQVLSLVRGYFTEFFERIETCNCSDEKCES